MNRNGAVVRGLVLAVVFLTFSAASFSQIAVGISVRVGPPALPVYAQPLCPGPGYFWTPGYWGWNDDAGYYWVPGTWVVAPVGMLWTPGYWGWGGGFYAWHAGYWGRTSASMAGLTTDSATAAWASAEANGAAEHFSTTAPSPTSASRM